MFAAYTRDPSYSPGPILNWKMAIDLIKCASSATAEHFGRKPKFTIAWLVDTSAPLKF